MDLMTMWEQARGEVALPEPAGAIEVDVGPFLDGAGQQIGRVQQWDDGYSADQMRAIATPDPETMKRFAEMVAEECCAAVAKAGPSEGPLSLVTRGFVDAIRRHVKGE